MSVLMSFSSEKEEKHEEKGNEKVASTIIRDLRENDILSLKGSGLSKADVDARPGNELFLQIIQEFS